MSTNNKLNASNPGFIQHFFASSRLHHLSTWKADLTDYVAQYIQNNNARSNLFGSTTNRFRVSKPGDKLRTIMHVDMDCFFASVAMKNRPDLLNRPVAIAHSVKGLSQDFSTSEIASCNYIARSKGVKNGMYIGSAKSMVADLVILPYDFHAYDVCAKQLYDILLECTDYVQAVSCDEAYVDITFKVRDRLREVDGNDSSQYDIVYGIAEEIRQKIFDTTGCHASIGASINLLLARLCTKLAKPNGVYILITSYSRATDQRFASKNNVSNSNGNNSSNDLTYISDDGDENEWKCPAATNNNGVSTPLELLRELPITDLPGMGPAIADKCAALKWYRCGDIQMVPLALLCHELGPKTGETIFNYCSGKDDRVLVNKTRSSIGSDINWGIRFSSDEEVEKFLKEFSFEVYGRLEKLNMVASHVTLTIKKKLYEGEPQKFLGCGHCMDYSKSRSLNSAISSSNVLFIHVLELYKEIALIPGDLRGVGIHLKKLSQVKVRSNSCSASALPERVIDGKVTIEDKISSNASLEATQHRSLHSYWTKEGDQRKQIPETSSTNDTALMIDKYSSSCEPDGTPATNNSSSASVSNNSIGHGTDWLSLNHLSKNSPGGNSKDGALASNCEHKPPIQAKKHSIANYFSLHSKETSLPASSNRAVNFSQKSQVFFADKKCNDDKVDKSTEWKGLIGVDWNFLQSLPEDIRREQLRELQQKQLNWQQKSKKSSTSRKREVVPTSGSNKRR